MQIQRRVEAWAAGAAYEKRWHVVPLADIGPHLRHAVVAAEDSRFYSHGGLDLTEIERAIEQSRKRGRGLRGASTITQQLVKNLFLTTHSWWLRKAFEIPLALLAELILTKQRILELYLNIVEWGPGVYGAEAAARHHYGVAAAALGREQSARLAACLPAPRSRRPQTMNRYGAVIQRRMAEMGW